MYECKINGGHFFVHSPHLRSFVCHRCCEPFTNYNPPVPRTKSAKQWYGDMLGDEAAVDPDRKKAPWRCIIETCAFTTCEPCAEAVQQELGRLKEEREAAEAAGTPFDFEAELAKVEARGRVGIEVGKAGTKREMEVDKDDCNKKEDCRARSSAGHASAGSIGKISVDSRMEVDDEDDGDGGEYSLELFKRTFTRTAASAAAQASVRARARRPTIGKREMERECREPTRRRAM
jgi:hypothetical protein